MKECRDEENGSPFLRVNETAKKLASIIICKLNFKMKIQAEASTILKILLGVGFVTCLPFIICDLYFYNKGLQDIIDDLVNDTVDNDTLCFLKNGGTSITLDVWLAADAYIKIAILVLLIIFNFITCCQNESSGLLHGAGITLFIGYLFNLIWFIIGIAIYSQEHITIYIYTIQLTCSEEFSSYIVAALVIGIILTLINMILVWLRPAPKPVIRNSTQVQSAQNLQTQNI